MRLWSVWAMRDARRHWVQVLSIALLVALGTGMYSAMSSMSRWRVASADASYAQARMHDLRVALADASYAREGSLLAASRRIPDSAYVQAAEERLVLPTQVDASRGGTSIIVPGRVVGASLRPAVDRTVVDFGRALSLADNGRPVVALERNFASHYGLPAQGTLRLSGGRSVSYVGLVYAPEYFIVTAPGADFGAEASFAAIFTSLRTAQTLSGETGRVNELVLRAPDARLAQIERQLSAALRRSVPGIGFTLTTRHAEPAHRLIYEDAKNDQQMMDIFAVLLLGAAAFAAFNLVSRAVEAQRREIGIGMALGVRPARLAVRPVLLGVQIAIASIVLGIPLGLLANSRFGSLLSTWFPLPVAERPFEADLFVRGAVLALALPLLATVLPVWRAVRVTPVEAIRVGARAAKTSGLAWLAKGARVPGGSLANMPLRNVLRTPRRTALTLLGIAAVVTIVVALSGVMDSFNRTLDAARAEALAGSRARLTADLIAPQPARAPAVRAVTGAGVVGTSQAALRLPVTVRSPRAHFTAFLETVNARMPVWHPTLASGSLAGRPGVAIARVAAHDLGVHLGDTIALRHPLPSKGGGFALETSPVRVVALHTSPFRFLVYGSPTLARTLGLGGIVNRISVVPAPGYSATAVKRALMQVPGVASVQAATASTDAVDKRMAQFTDVLVLTVAIALAMALLMAFNASSINADERARETATMFAFGLHLRRVMRIAVEEALLVGLLATVLGLFLGYALLRWLVQSSMPDTMPDIGMVIAIDPLTVAYALIAGTLAVAAAPLLTRRRLAKTDIPSTLRVME